MTAAGIAMLIGAIVLSGEAASDVARPYRVRLLLAIDPAPALPESSASDLIHDLQSHFAQTVGKCWQLEIDRAPVDAQFRLPKPEATGEHAELKLDKILLVRLHSRPDRIMPTVVVQEYDGTLRSWGPPLTRAVGGDRELPMQIVRQCLRMFRPVAQIVGKEKQRVTLRVQGAVNLPATSDVLLLADGDPLTIARIWEKENDRPEQVPWSYLVATGSGSVSRRFSSDAEIVSVFRDPLTKRSRQPVRIAAVACRAGDDPATTVEFRSRPDDRPIVGYEVAARPMGQSGFVSLGATNYSGEIVVSLEETIGRPTARVVDVLLMSGNLILARFPIVPGDPPNLLAQTSIDPLLPEFAGQVIAFQESVVDLAARRKILELRLKKASTESNVEGMKSLADRINQLPDKEFMQQQLSSLLDSATIRSKALGQKSLGLNLRRLFSQTEALVDRSVSQEKYQIQVQPVETPAEKPAETKAP